MKSPHAYMNSTYWITNLALPNIGIIQRLVPKPQPTVDLATLLGNLHGDDILCDVSLKRDYNLLIFYVTMTPQ